MDTLDTFMLAFDSLIVCCQGYHCIGLQYITDDMCFYILCRFY